jgi:hypothetical protein
MGSELVAGSRICQETLYCVDGNSFIEPPAIADRLAGMPANPAAYTREGVFDERSFPCLFEKPL